jgi:hypothetical protein
MRERTIGCAGTRDAGRRLVARKGETKMSSDDASEGPDRATIANRHPQGGERGSSHPTRTQERPNISTEHQEPGDARRPGDQLDRDQPTTDDSDDKTSLTRNA